MVVIRNTTSLTGFKLVTLGELQLRTQKYCTRVIHEGTNVRIVLQDPSENKRTGYGP